MVVIAVMRQYAFPWHQLSPSDTVEAAVLGGSSQRSLSPSWTQMLLTCVYASSLFALLASSLSDIALFADINCRSTSGTFLWPLPSLGMYCLGLPAICEWSCLPYLLGSIEVRIWGQVSSVSWDTYYTRECFTTYRLWEFEFHSRFCFHDTYIVECWKILYSRSRDLTDWPRRRQSSSRSSGRIKCATIC